MRQPSSTRNSKHSGFNCRSAFVMTAWLPSYFSDSLSLSLTEASQAALFPPIAAIVASGIASPVADAMVAKGTPVALVRKTAQVCYLLLCLACCVNCICNASRGCQEISVFVANSTSKALALYLHHTRVHCSSLCRGWHFWGPHCSSLWQPISEVEAQRMRP